MASGVLLVQLAPSELGQGSVLVHHAVDSVARLGTALAPVMGVPVVAFVVLVVLLVLAVPPDGRYQITF
eukprot:7382102-Ditylum_brightwellii.AAC.1